MIREPADRFLEKMIPEPNSGCWLWMAAFRKTGRLYGCFALDGHKLLLHIELVGRYFVGISPPACTCFTSATILPVSILAIYL
jgi:hypothetical protein